MTKPELIEYTKESKEFIHNLLQLVNDTLNKGQRKKLLGNEELKNYWDLFYVEYEL